MALDEPAVARPMQRRRAVSARSRQQRRESDRAVTERADRRAWTMHERAYRRRRHVGDIPYIDAWIPAERREVLREEPRLGGECTVRGPVPAGEDVDEHRGAGDAGLGDHALRDGVELGGRGVGAGVAVRDEQGGRGGGQDPSYVHGHLLEVRGNLTRRSRARSARMQRLADPQRGAPSWLLSPMTSTWRGPGSRGCFATWRSFIGSGRRRRSTSTATTGS